MDSSTPVEIYLMLAQIRPDATDEVRHALVAAGIPQITVLRCADHGDVDPADAELFRGARVEPGLTPRVQVQVRVAAGQLADASRTVRRVEPTARCWALPLKEI